MATNQAVGAGPSASTAATSSATPAPLYVPHTWRGVPYGAPALQATKHRFPCIGARCAAQSMIHDPPTLCQPYFDSSREPGDRCRFQRMCGACWNAGAQLWYSAAEAAEAAATAAAAASAAAISAELDAIPDAVLEAAVRQAEGGEAAAPSDDDALPPDDSYLAAASGDEAEDAEPLPPPPPLPPPSDQPQPAHRRATPAASAHR